MCSCRPKHPQVATAERERSLCRAQSPDKTPLLQQALPLQPCCSPLAQDDPELGVVQAGDGHVRQLELLQLPHNCKETATQQQLRAAEAHQTPASQSTPGEPAGSPYPGQGRGVQVHSSCARAGYRAGVPLQPSWGSSVHYSQEKAPSLVSLTRKRLK